MAQFTSDQFERFWTHELDKYQQAGAGHLRAPCPVHDGDAPDTLSVDLTTGYAHCFKCHGSNGNRGWNMIEFAMARHGLTKALAWDYVRGIVGDARPSTALWKFPFAKPTTITSDDWRLGTLARRIEQYTGEYLPEHNQPGYTPTALYPYETIDSVKIRLFNPATGDKRMIWFSLTAKGGWSTPKKLGLKAPPYRARTLKGQPEIWLLNGEKACDRARDDWDITVTCLPNGEGKWEPEYLSWFQEAKEIYLVLDNDPAGEEHGRIVGGALALAGLNARLVRLPGLAEKADLWDWIEAGGTLVEAQMIARQAPLAEPAEPAPAKSKIKEMPRRPPPPGGGGDSGPPIEGPDLTGYDRNDTGNAQRLVAFAGDRLRYVRHFADAWLYFDGTRWRTGAVEEAYGPAKDTMELLKQQANQRDDAKLWNFANSKQNAGGIHNMIDLAKKLLAIDVDELDRRPHLINCLNGTLDLDTGELREHRASDYLTHIFPFTYDPQAAEPLLFLRCLFEWFGGTSEASEGDLNHIDHLIAYIRRVMGYLLTGNVKEKAFFVLYGTGNNGKSTFIDTLIAVFGDYAVTISPGTLTKAYGRNENNANADVARTKGARSIFTSEPDEGQKFDQGLLKKLTQGDVPITGVFKGQQPFSFRPTGKLILETNTIPDFNDDDAFAVRMHPIRFPMKFPGGAKAGQTLRDRITPEDSLIFNWAIAGARDWHTNGLMEPLEDRQEQMKTIRDEQARNDGLEPFLEEYFDLGPEKSCTLAEVETLYRQWSERYKGRLLTRNRLSRMLCRRLEITHGNDPKNHKEPAWLKGLAPKGARAAWINQDQSAQYKETRDDD